MSRIMRIPRVWMPDCKPTRLILHWTAGGYSATLLDRMHYHVCIEGDGNHVRGIPSIRDNCPMTVRYARHCLNANGGAIGVAVCCMRGARQRPFHGGPSPITKGQWNALIIAAADICRRYDLPVSPWTVLGHGEVETILGIRQKGKWEFQLPWEPDWTVGGTGNELRRRVSLAIKERV